MKKYIVLLPVLFIGFVVSAQEVPDDWVRGVPRDTPSFKYMRGISLPSATERDAVENAEHTALQRLAERIGTDVSKSATIKTKTETDEDDSFYSSSTSDETASIVTKMVQLTGVQFLDQKILIENGKYIAYVLAAISVEDYAKAVESTKPKKTFTLVLADPDEGTERISLKVKELLLKMGFEESDAGAGYIVTVKVTVREDGRSFPDYPATLQSSVDVKIASASGGTGVPYPKTLPPVKSKNVFQYGTAYRNIERDLESNFITKISTLLDK